MFTYGTSGLHRWPLQRELKRTADQPDGINILQVGPPEDLGVPGNWNYAGIRSDRKGRWLAVTDYPRGRVILLEPDKPARKLVLAHPGVGGCVLSPDGRWAVTCAGYQMKAWDTSTGQLVREIGRGFGPFSPDGRWLLTASPDDNILRYWQVGSWQPGPAFPGRTAKFVGLTFSPSGEFLLASDTPPKLLHVDTGAELATLEARNDNAFDVPASFSPDGAWLAVGTGNHTLHVWDLRAVRRQLAEIGLDWNLSPYPPVPVSSGKPLQVRVDIGNIEKVREAEAQLRQAGAHVQAGQWNKAVAAYSKALELNPADARTHNDLAWVLATCPDASARDVERAPKLAKRAVELAPQEGFYWNTLGVAHYRAGDWTASVEALRKSDALLRGEQLGFNAFFMAMAHWRLGDKSVAQDWYEQAFTWVEHKREELERNPHGREELRRFRAEAGQLLGVKEGTPPGDKAK